MHERLYAQCHESKMTRVESLNYKVWIWLKRDPEQVLFKNSVSTATLEAAFEEWGGLTTAKLKDLQAKHDIKNCKIGEMLNVVIPLSAVSSDAASTSASTPKARRENVKKKQRSHHLLRHHLIGHQQRHHQRRETVNLRVTRQAGDGYERTVTRIGTHPSLSAEGLSD